MRRERPDEEPANVCVELPVRPDTPTEARRAVERLGRSVGPGPMEDLSILITEVVTNVVRHARFSLGADPLIRVRVAVKGRYVEASVCDTGEGFEPPARPRPREDMSGGWGLFMVDKLSERWGTRREDDLFCVWFELAC